MDAPDGGIPMGRGVQRLCCTASVGSQESPTHYGSPLPPDSPQPLRPAFEVSGAAGGALVSYGKGRQRPQSGAKGRAQSAAKSGRVPP